MAEPASGMPVHRLADHTTLRLGGPALRWLPAATEEELVAAVADADAADEPVLVLAGGSNLVVADDGFPGTVIEVATRGVVVDGDSDGVVRVTAAAGEPWDPFVASAVAQGWTGVEALSGIPGSVGATPIQNVGAYGQEVADSVTAVRVWDRRLRGLRTLPGTDCGFGYRTSRFKADAGRHVVLSVTYRFARDPAGWPVGYAELARALGVAVGESAPAASVREAVLEVRRAKGMVLDETDRDTWSAGSFFTNPVVAGDRLPAGAPAWPVAGPEAGPGAGQVKTSAAWLIERAGFFRGYGRGSVTVSNKHTLALTNRGGATTTELLALAREIRDGVEQRFGIRLAPEPVLVGCAL